MSKTLSKKKLKDNLFVYSLIGYPLLLFIFFFVVVNFNSILLAFQEIDGKGTHFVGLKNFKTVFTEVFANGELLKYSFVNSIKMYLIGFIISTPLSFLFSYLLFKNCRGNKFVIIVGMIPNMMSGFVISLVTIRIIGQGGPLDYMCSKFNWFGGTKPDLLQDERYAFSFTNFYSIWLSFAMSFVMLPTSMRGINTEIFESGKIDGINNMFQEIWYIVLPLIYPTLSTFWITGVASIFTNGGPLLTFYAKDAPAHVSNMGYYFTQVLLDGSEYAYPKSAACGLLLTLVMAPLTMLVKWALEKFGPSED